MHNFERTLDISSTQKGRELMKVINLDDWRQKPAVTVQKAMAILDVSRAHAYRLISTGQLAHFRAGNAIRIPTKALKDLIDGEAA